MTNIFNVEKNGQQRLVIVRQMSHDLQYTVGSRIPSLGRVIEVISTGQLSERIKQINRCTDELADIRSLVGRIDPIEYRRYQRIKRA